MTGEVTTGEKIKAYIDDKGIKQTRLAEQIGSNVQKVNRILKGHQDMPLSVYVAICCALDKDLYAFIEEDMH